MSTSPFALSGHKRLTNAPATSQGSSLWSGRGQTQAVLCNGEGSCALLHTQDLWVHIGLYLDHLYLCFRLISVFVFLIFIYWFERERQRETERGRERETLICCSTYLCIHWLILVCTLTGDWTHNLGTLGWPSIQMSYLARAHLCFCFGLRIPVSIKSTLSPRLFL